MMANSNIVNVTVGLDHNRSFYYTSLGRLEKIAEEFLIDVDRKTYSLRTDRPAEGNRVRYVMLKPRLRSQSPGMNALVNSI